MRHTDTERERERESARWGGGRLIVSQDCVFINEGGIGK